MNLRPLKSRHFITPGELSYFCACSPLTIRRAIQAGKIAAFRFRSGAIWHIPKKEAVKFLKKSGFEIPKELLK